MMKIVSMKRVAGVVLLITGIGYALISKSFTGAVVGSSSFNVFGLVGIFAFIGGIALLTIASMEKGLLIKTEDYNKCVEGKDKSKIYKLMEYIGDEKYMKKDLWGTHIEVPGLGKLTYKEKEGNYILLNYEEPERVRI